MKLSEVTIYCRACGKKIISINIPVAIEDREKLIFCSCGKSKAKQLREIIHDVRTVGGLTCGGEYYL